MEKTNTSKSLMFGIGIALLVCAIGVVMVGGKQSSKARADRVRTTERTAAVAGVQVMPPEPSYGSSRNRNLIHRKAFF
jgi:hypothetical protein